MIVSPSLQCSNRVAFFILNTSQFQKWRSVLVPQMAVKMISRYRGAMLGGLVGDCLGATFEMKYQTMVPARKVTAFLQEVEQMDPETDELFRYTDDTAMARQIALSYLEQGRLEPASLARSFTLEYFREPWRGYGGSVVEVFTKLRASQFSHPFQPAAQQFNGSGSYGNGAGMRAHAVGLAAGGAGEGSAQSAAEEVARLTHSHPLGVRGGVVQALAVWHALQGASPAKILAACQSLVAELEEGDPHSQYTHKLQLVASSLHKPDSDLEEIMFELGNDVSAVDSIPTALFCFLRVLNEAGSTDDPCSTFQRVLELAIRAGGDTDTIACMACSLAGAHLGSQAIPVWMTQSCENSEAVADMAERMFRQAFDRKNSEDQPTEQSSAKKQKIDSTEEKVK